jgi:hypothetical protein
MVRGAFVVKGRFAFAIPGDLSTPTGGYAYDRRVLAELAGLGWSIERIALGNDFPRPSPETLADAAASLTAVPAGQPILIDGLAFGAMPDVAAALETTHPVIALVHHPLALETGLSAEDAEALRFSAGDCPSGHRHQPHDGGAAWFRIRRAARAHNRRPARQRSGGADGAFARRPR